MQGILSPVSCMRVRDGPVTSLPLISVRTKPIQSDDQFFSPRKFEMILDWGHGEFLISWEYIDTHGNRGTESEVVTYMHKRL